VKRVILVCEVSNEDEDEIVAHARIALPTWHVIVEDIEETYKTRLHCLNCHHTWVGRFPVGTRVPTEVECPNCKCTVRS